MTRNCKKYALRKLGDESGTRSREAFYHIIFSCHSDDTSILVIGLDVGSAATPGVREFNVLDY